MTDIGTAAVKGSDMVQDHWLSSLVKYMQERNNNERYSLHITAMPDRKYKVQDQFKVQSMVRYWSYITPYMDNCHKTAHLQENLSEPI